MRQPTTFQVYNASAGSGKTFTLVKEYLKIVLSTENIFAFQKILAITFTNKAAGEMKERVLKSLEDFADGKESDLLHQILQEITVDKHIIQLRSKKILEAILQNYAAFSITTIDSFTHKIIKNFAFDLKLPLNFEVEMDTDTLLKQAVDLLISKIGTDTKLTEILIDYSLDKTDNDASWDITRELNDFAKILLKEEDALHFKKLKNNTLDDFRELKKRIISHNKYIEKQFQQLGNEVLLYIKNQQLNHSDFSYSDYPNHFIKLQNLKLDLLIFEGRLHKSIEDDKNLYSAKVTSTSKNTMDELKNQFFNYYHLSKELADRYLPTYKIQKLALKSVVPLAVLNNINQELEKIKSENNILLISEFNHLISNELKEQPAPYIYERIGQRFQHYFIDEMQDTSGLQWQNLIPLIDNALSQIQGSLLLVGDGKQAIYRWRGGKAAQFINLSAGIENPFQIEKSLQNLTTNFRSHAEIIRFNNQFFTFLANFLSNESYKNLFLEGNNQAENSKKGGFISVEFVDKEEEEEQQEDDLAVISSKNPYPKKVFQKIEALKQQFLLNEICVLTRTRHEGVDIANYLLQQQIPIISSETLLLKNNEKIAFIVCFLRLIQQPEDEETRFEILYFLHQHLQISIEKHDFLDRYKSFKNHQLFQNLQEYNIFFDEINFQQIPLYEKIEEIIRTFHLANSSDAYLQFFLDVMLEQQKKGTDVAAFLEFWETKKESLSIVAPESANAVQIMTIHKAKGLEFPVVIFPSDLNIYNYRNTKVWLDDLPEIFIPFQELLIDFSARFQRLNDKTSAIYNQHLEELELDNFNLLYVALTRAVEQLHIITGHNLPKKENDKPTFFSQVFVAFLKQQQQQWNDNVFEYTFGNSQRVSLKKNIKLLSQEHQKLISIPWKEQPLVLLASASKLWDTPQGKAIEFGNLIHEMLAKINTFHDVEKVMLKYLSEGYFLESERKYIQQIINEIVFHPLLKKFFIENTSCFNEREIVDLDGQIIIPDRLVFENTKNVVIMDYKTGNPIQNHHQQLLRYEKVLTNMNFTVSQKLLIYISDTIEVVKVA